MTLDNLLEVLPGLRRMRTINADMLRILLDRKKKECTWCGSAVPPRASKWCSPACVSAFKLRCDSGTQRAAVESRDKGICQLCGRNVTESKAAYEAEEAALKPTLPHGWSDRDKILNPIRERYGYARGRWFEIDHNPPVVEYGGLCDIASLRLLCGCCHAAETKSLAARRKI